MSGRGDTIGIVGAGPFGLALAALVGRSGRSAMLFSSSAEVVAEVNEKRASKRMPGLELPTSVRATTEHKELAESARFLVIALSSADVRRRLHSLGDFVDGSHMAVHAIGAFAAPGDERVTEVISQETPILRTGVIAGPSMANDLAEGRGTSLVCASSFDEVTSECRRLLGVPPIMRLYQSRDVVGAELASALSGAYTIAVGLADGLKVGIGTRAVLITRAVSEMWRLGKAAGADPKTFAGLAGLGNLLVRTSVEDGRYSPSYRVGLAYAQGQAPTGINEGVSAARAGARLANALGVRLPILDTTAKVLAGEMSPAEAAETILATVAQEE